MRLFLFIAFAVQLIAFADIALSAGTHCPSLNQNLESKCRLDPANFQSSSPINLCFYSNSEKKTEPNLYVLTQGKIFKTNSESRNIVYYKEKNIDGSANSIKLVWNRKNGTANTVINHQPFYGHCY